MDHLKETRYLLSVVPNAFDSIKSQTIVREDYYYPCYRIRHINDGWFWVSDQEAGLIHKKYEKIDPPTAKFLKRTKLHLKVQGKVTTYGNIHSYLEKVTAKGKGVTLTFYSTEVETKEAEDALQTLKFFGVTSIEEFPNASLKDMSLTLIDSYIRDYS